MFEEEYQTQRKKKLKEDINPNHREYLQKDYNSENKLCVHEGYFSGDRGNREAKGNHGVNLILNDKSKLLSIKEPLRFVFSVWALQEGWDNPNVFNSWARVKACSC